MGFLFPGIHLGVGCGSRKVFSLLGGREGTGFGVSPANVAQDKEHIFPTKPKGLIAFSRAHPRAWARSSVSQRGRTWQFSKALAGSIIIDVFCP